MELLFEAIGALGAIIFFVAFAGLLLRKLNPKKYLFRFLLLVGSALSAFYALELDSTPFMALFGLTAVIAIVLILGKLFKRVDAKEALSDIDVEEASGNL